MKKSRDAREQHGGGGEDEHDGDRRSPMAQSCPGSQPYRRGYDGQRDQSRDESDQKTSGEGFRTQHHHRQTADGRDQCAEMAKDDQGETSQEDRCRDAGPYSQHPGTGAGRVDVGQGPVPQMRMRVLLRKAVDTRACQRFPLFGKGLAAFACLHEGGLQRGQADGVPPVSSWEENATQAGRGVGPEPGDQGRVEARAGVGGVVLGGLAPVRPGALHAGQHVGRYRTQVPGPFGRRDQDGGGSVVLPREQSNRRSGCMASSGKTYSI
jgi:hypothetical protein